MKWFPFKSGVPYTCKDCPALAEVSEPKIPSLGERMTTYMDMKAQMTALAFEVRRWKDNAILFAEESRAITNKLIAERNEWRRIATKLVAGAEEQIDVWRPAGAKNLNEAWLAAWHEYDNAVSSQTENDDSSRENGETE